jgi:hypothetical protein
MIDAHQREITAVGAEPGPRARILEGGVPVAWPLSRTLPKPAEVATFRKEKAGALFAVMFSIRAGARSRGDGGAVAVP